MILILGGARSGKSKLAVELAKKQCKKVAYLATAPACDEEMKQRIKHHKKSRPKNWITIEVESDLITSLRKIPRYCDGVIIECIGTYVSNLMHKGLNDKGVIRDIKRVLVYLKRMHKKIFIVSNEVGGGVVPKSELGRQFRDSIGIVNQIIAKDCDEVYLVVSGLPLRLK